MPNKKPSKHADRTNADAARLKTEPNAAKSAQKTTKKSARKSAQKSANKSDKHSLRRETSKPLTIFSQDLSNRESSFLAFNERVLALADDSSIPLLERLRYLCISSSNLDEFFEVRVAGIKQKVIGGVEAAGIDGFSPQQELNLINKSAHEFVAKQYKLLNDVLLPGLASEDIKFLVRGNWDDKVMAWIKEYFNDEIAPVLSPPQAYEQEPELHCRFAGSGCVRPRIRFCFSTCATITATSYTSARADLRFGSWFCVPELYYTFANEFVI